LLDAANIPILSLQQKVFANLFNLCLFGIDLVN
jgi:hypothetical protein